MKNGPVTSHIYDRIKAAKNPNSHPAMWSLPFQPCPDLFLVRIAKDPGSSELSRAEERLLPEVFSKRGTVNPFALADETHLEFPEWQDRSGLQRYSNHN